MVEKLTQDEVEHLWTLQVDEMSGLGNLSQIEPGEFLRGHERIEFADDWFKAESADVPDHDLDEELKKETV